MEAGPSFGGHLGSLDRQPRAVVSNFRCGMVAIRVAMNLTETYVQIF